MIDLGSGISVLLLGIVLASGGCVVLVVVVRGARRRDAKAGAGTNIQEIAPGQYHVYQERSRIGCGTILIALISAFAALGGVTLVLAGAIALLLGR